MNCSHLSGFGFSWDSCCCFSNWIERSQGEKQKRINEADRKAAEIEKVAVATATGIRQIASAITESVRRKNGSRRYPHPE